MIILPAIDMKDGRCVRLYQGDYNQVTTYANDPVEVALRFQNAGASWLHLVDLDGAAQGFPVNSELIGRICAATRLHVEVGGGMRSQAHIEQMFSLGVERVILGTAALKDRDLLRGVLARWGGKIAVGLDARDGLVAVSGWRETSTTEAVALATDLSALGVERFIYTDIARDGTLVGPNLPALEAMARATDRALIASGGVSRLDDLFALNQLGIEGAIVGKAIYTGDLDLAQAIHEIERQS